MTTSVDGQQNCRIRAAEQPHQVPKGNVRCRLLYDLYLLQNFFLSLNFYLLPFIFIFISFSSSLSLFSENSGKGNIYLGISELPPFSHIQYIENKEETAVIFLQGGAPRHFSLTFRHALIASFLFHGLGDVNQ
jgi:hypothetical protein